MRTIPINFQPPKSIVQPIPINRQHPKSIVRTPSINGPAPEINCLDNRFQLMDSLRNQMYKDSQFIDNTRPIAHTIPIIVSQIYCLDQLNDNRRNQFSGHFQLIDNRRKQLKTRY